MKDNEVFRFFLYGGRFDPPHRGHLAVGLHVVSHFPSIEGLFFIPAGIPPHESSTCFSHCERYALLLLSALHDDRFFVWDYELRKTSPAYTIETIRAFQKTFGCTSEDIAFIVGADAFLKLHTWYDFENLKSLTSWYVVHREPHHEREIRGYARKYFREFPFLVMNGVDSVPATPAVLYDPCLRTPESSTSVRAHLNALDKVREFLNREEYRALQKILFVKKGTLTEKMEVE